MKPRADCGFNIVLTVRRINTVHSHIILSAAVGPRTKSFHNTLSRCGFLTDCYRIFKIENDRIGTHLEHFFHSARVIGRRE